MRLRVIPSVIVGVIVFSFAPLIRAVPPGFVIETVYSGLNSPVVLAFAPDGRIFYNEMDGRVRVIENGAVLPVPFAAIATTTVGEAGLLGLALHPEFAENGYLYVCFAKPGGGYEIGRYTDVANIGTEYTPVVVDLPGATFHNGGNIAFGPDGKLYHSMGDNLTSSNAQLSTNYPGKIHRFNDDGTVPADNPYRDGLLSRYCMGLRNSFDLCWNQELGLLYASENGPASDDEVNLITAGSNYGWPGERCFGPAFEPALTCWTPTVAPTGITAYTGSEFGLEFTNDLFVGDFNGGRIWRIDLSRDGLSFIARELFHDGPTAVLDVVLGPDGDLYYTTFTQILRIRRENIDAPFKRGDVDADGVVNGLVDGLFLLDFGFLQGATPLCRDAADVDDDGALNALVDTLSLLSFRFLDGVPPPSPHPDCGEDPTVDSVGCEGHPSCP